MPRLTRRDGSQVAGPAQWTRKRMFKRILMNQVDASPGNSAPAVAETSAATVPQAQGETITMTKAELEAHVAAGSTKAIEAVKDSIYAEARRTFTAPNKTSKKSDDSNAPTALTASEERTLLRGGDRSISQLGIAPNADQYARFERDLLADRPADVTTYTKDYFAGFQVSTPAPASTPAAPAAPQAAQQPKPLNAHPASDRGSPPPSQVPLAEADLVTMSDTDRQALIKEKGLVWYRNRLAGQLKGRQISLR